MTCRKCQSPIKYDPENGAATCTKCGTMVFAKDVFVIPKMHPEIPKLVIAVPENQKEGIVDFIRKNASTILGTQGWGSVGVRQDKENGDMFVILSTDDDFPSWLYGRYKCLYEDEQTRIRFDTGENVYLSSEHSQKILSLVQREIAKSDITMEVYRQYGYKASALNPESVYLFDHKFWDYSTLRERRFRFHYMTGVSFEDAVNESSPNYLIDKFTDRYIELQKDHCGLTPELFVHDIIYEIIHERVKKIFVAKYERIKEYGESPYTIDQMVSTIVDHLLDYDSSKHKKNANLSNLAERFEEDIHKCMRGYERWRRIAESVK